MAESARILVVEDDPNHAAMCARLLERKGYQARSTTSGREALSMLAQNGEVDLVLADLLHGDLTTTLLEALHRRDEHAEAGGIQETDVFEVE